MPALSRFGSDPGPGALEIVQVCLMGPPPTGRRRQPPPRGSRPARSRISWPCSGGFRSWPVRRNRRDPVPPRAPAHRTERCRVGREVLTTVPKGLSDAGVGRTHPRPPCPKSLCLRPSGGSPRPWLSCSSRTTGASMTPWSSARARPRRSGGARRARCGSSTST